MSETPRNSWIIGSRDDCDLTVDQPAVSGEHCRLTLAGTRFLLEDLQSTNGTFVNGKRIEGKVVISKDDSVKLGQNCDMPWPKLSNAGGRTISIGASDDNDIVINEPMVSGQHAVLRQTDSGWEIEDLGSTNGTFVNDPEKRISKAFVTAADKIFLGSHPIAIAQMIGDQTGSPTVSAAVSPRATSGKSDGLKNYGMIIGVVAVALLFIVGYVATRPPRGVSSSSNELPKGQNADPSQRTGSTTDPAPPKNGSELTEPTKLQSGPVENGDSTTRSEETTELGEEQDSEETSDTEVDPLTETMFQLAVGTGKDVGADDATSEKHEYRIGSAWPVRPDLLITSAYAIRSMSDFDSEQLPDQFVFNMATGERIGVAESGMNPRYQAAHGLFRESVQRFKEIQASTGIGTGGQPDKATLAEGADLDAIGEQYKEARLEAAMAYREMAMSNVGWVRLEKPLENVQLISLAETGKLRVNQSVHMFGAMFAADDPYLDMAADQMCFRVGAQAIQPEKVGPEDGDLLWMFNSRQNWHQLNAEGCILVDPKAKDRLLGMYSQPLATPETSHEDGRFQIVNASTIREFVESLL